MKHHNIKHLNNKLSFESKTMYLTFVGTKVKIDLMDLIV